MRKLGRGSTKRFSSNPLIAAAAAAAVLGAFPAAAAPVGSNYFAVTPCRAVDTRGPAGPLGGPSFGANELRVFTIAGTCGVPLSAIAISGNLIAVNPGAAGVLRVFPANLPEPSTNTSSFDAGHTRAGSGIARLATDNSGTLAIRNVSAGPVDVVLDVTGYFDGSCPSITVDPPALSSVADGTPVGVTLTASGGVVPFTFAVTSGALPAGVTLSPAGVLSGTAAASGSFPFTATATDFNNCTGSRAYTLVLTCPTITVTPTTLSPGAVGVPYTPVNFNQTGAVGAVTWSFTGSLPTGMNLSAAGVLSGTPTQAGTFPITVKATDAGGCTGSVSVTLSTCPSVTVTNPATASATAGTPFSQTFTQSGGAPPIAFTVGSGTLPTGLTLAANGTLSGTPTQTGTFPITVKATDVNGCFGTGGIYPLVVGCGIVTVGNPGVTTGTANAPFSQTFTQTGGIGAVTFTLASGTLPTGLTLAANGTLAGTPTQTGSFPITVKATDSNTCNGTGATYTLVISCQTITVTKPAVTTGAVGAAFSQTFTQTNAIGTATFTTASTLPSGMSLSAAGVLSGTPTQTGSFPIVVKVTDSNGCIGTSTTYTLVIGCQAIVVTNPATATGTVSTPFSQAFTQLGAVGTATFTTASTLPNGLTLATNGTLSGTPTQTGTFPIVVTVTDSNGCTGIGATYTLVVSCQTFSVQPTSIPPGTAGTLYPAVAFKHAGGIDPVVFTFTGTLPTGMSLVSGLLQGTPTQTGSFPFTVTATDVNGCTASRDYVLVVSCVGVDIVLAPASLPTVVVGAAFPATTFTASGGTGSYTFQQVGTLPNGMQFLTDTLSGTPTQTGAFPITVVATDAAGCVGSQEYVVTVTCVGVTITVDPPTVPSVQAGSPFGPVTFTGSGGTGPYTFVRTGVLPAGMLFGPNTLSGSPTQQGTFPFTITATDANGCSGSTSYTLVVTCPTITVTNPAVATGTVSTFFSQSFGQTGGNGAVTFTTASALPTGLALSSAGVLSGTPTQAGTFPITVKATDANGCTGTGTTYTLVIACQTITVTSPIVNSGLEGSAFLQTFSQSGAVGGTTFTLASGSLPAGWSLSSLGVLSNPGPAAGQFTITVKVTDANGCTGTSASYTVTIAPLAVSDAYAPAIVGNMSIDTSTGTNFSVLTNDSPGSTPNLLGGGTTAQGGQIALNPLGQFTYNPPRGFQGTDTFQYTVTKNGVTSAPATVTLTVTGVVWFVNDNPGACVSTCDGRNATPYTTLAAFQAVNDATGTNPKPGDRIFLYESNPPNPYVGPVTLQSGQRLIGQDFSGNFASATGFAVPDTTVSVPVMDPVNGPVTEVTNGPGLNAINLVTDAVVVGLKATASSGRAISQALAPPAVGAAPLGTTILNEVNIQTTGAGTALAVFSTTGTLLYPNGSITALGSNSVSAVFIQGGTSAINIGVPITSAGAGNISISQRGPGASTTFNGPVNMTGAATGIAIGAPAGATSVTFNAAVQLGAGAGSRMTGAGLPAVAVNHSGTASTTTFASLSIFTNLLTGIQAQNGGTLNVGTGVVDVVGQQAIRIDGAPGGMALGISLASITQAGGSGGAAGVQLNATSGSLTSGATSLSNASTQGISLSSAAGTVNFGSTTIAGPGSQGILVTTSTANVNFGNTIINGGTDAVSLQNNAAGTRSFGSLTIGNTTPPTAIGFLHANGGGNTTVAGATTITNPVGNGVDIQNANSALTFNGVAISKNNSGLGVNLVNDPGLITFGSLSIASIGTAFSSSSASVSTNGGTINATGASALLATSTNFNASSLASVSASGGVNGISLTNVTGSLTMLGGSITGSTGTAFNLSGGTVNVGYGGTITQNTAQLAVAADSMTGGTKTFSGAITSITSGKGVSLTSNTGATTAFTGTLTLSTGAFPAFTATGGGTVTATGAGSTLTTTTGTALNVASTTIGAANLTFQSITSTTAGSNAGIVLNTTGASGGLVVTGTGTTAGSGGTISNKSTHGINLTSTSGTNLKNMNLTSNATSQSSTNIACGNNLVAGDTTLCTANLYMKTVSGVSLTNLSITGSTQQGIAGTSVSGFTLADSTISGNGNEDYEDGFLFKNLSGTVSITNTTVRDNFSRQTHIYNDAGSMSLTVSNSRFGRNIAPGVGSQQGMLIELAGGSHADVDMGTSTIDNNGNGNGLAIAVTASASLGSSGTHSSLHNMTSLTGNAAHIFMSTAGSAIAFFDTLNNAVMTAAGLQAIDYFAPGGSLTGIIQGNTIGTSGVAASACSAALAGCDGMTIDQAGNGALSLRIQSNTIQQVNTNGISLGSDISDNLNASITNNVIREPSNSAATNSQGNAFFLNVGISSGTVAGSTACINFVNNTIQDTASHTWDINGSGAAIYSNTRHSAITRLPGAWGAGTAAAQTFLGANNTFNLTGFGGTAPALVQASSGGTIVSGIACSVP